jgi:hypothetical protein
LSEKAKGKRPVRGDPAKDGSSIDPNENEDDESLLDTATKTAREKRGRNITIMFANAGEGDGGNLELWVEDGENIANVKDQVRSILSAPT